MAEVTVSTPLMFVSSSKTALEKDQYFGHYACAVRLLDVTFGPTWEISTPCGRRLEALLVSSSEVRQRTCEHCAATHHRWNPGYVRTGTRGARYLPLGGVEIGAGARWTVREIDLFLPWQRVLSDLHLAEGNSPPASAVYLRALRSEADKIGPAAYGYDLDRRHVMRTMRFVTPLGPYWLMAP